MVIHDRILEGMNQVLQWGDVLEDGMTLYGFVLIVERGLFLMKIYEDIIDNPTVI